MFMVNNDETAIISKEFAMPLQLFATRFLNLPKSWLYRLYC